MRKRVCMREGRGEGRGEKGKEEERNRTIREHFARCVLARGVADLGGAAP